jgi:formylglycine-generating enzyme required for sulfatase activity
MMTQFQWDRCAEDPYTSVHHNEELVPAAGASWTAVQATLSKLVGSPALPSRLQWEFACRGGTTTYWWTGAEPASLIGKENVRQQGEPTTPVRAIGAGSPNPFGFHDMHGNVWEWTQDARLAEYEHPPLEYAMEDGARDRRGASFRVIVGGSNGYDASYAHSSYSTAVTSAHTVGDLGFRPVMRLVKSEP